MSTSSSSSAPPSTSPKYQGLYFRDSDFGIHLPKWGIPVMVTAAVAVAVVVVVVIVWLTRRRSAPAAAEAELVVIPAEEAPAEETVGSGPPSSTSSVDAAGLTKTILVGR